MKRLWIAAALAAVFLLAGCQQNTETPAEKDTTPPAEVSALTAQAGSEEISLSWKNPGDDDLYQVEITAHPAHGSLKNAIYLAAEKGKNMTYTVESLSADTDYAFTVKTIDTSLNKSAGKTTESAVTLHHYDDPVIRSVSIPRAGISYAGNKLPVTITGKKFKAPDIAASFSGTGVSNFRVISDAKATAEVSCPDAAGEYSVTINCKSAAKTGTFTVKDYSAWTPGKIVLADKTLSDKDSFTLNTANPPIAVVCGKNVYGAAIGVALHKGSSLQWAEKDSAGYKKNFGEISCYLSSGESGSALTAAFTRDTDGSDNWDCICSVDPEGTANAAVYYPAFGWVLEYNTRYADKLGSARRAWYMPSLAELCELYKNKESINESLLKISGLNSDYADASLGTGHFWSSSQRLYDNKCAWIAYFGNGDLRGNYKDINNNVCCIAGF